MNEHLPDDIERRRRDFLVRLMAALGARADDIEDVAHDAWWRFHAQGYGDRPLAPKAEAALLARTGWCTYLDFLRRRRYRKTADLTDESCARESGPGRDPTADLESLVLSAGLNDLELRLLNRRFGEGVSIPELARAERVHTNTVRRQLERLIRRLRAAAAADRHAALLLTEN